MGTAWFAALCLLICMFQASVLVTAEEPTCAPGFESDMLIFEVFRNHLKRSTRLGKVGFTDCTDRTRFVFSSDDSHFMVQTDGILKVNRAVDIREHRDFFIHSWDSQGRKMSVPVRVVYYEHSHGNSHQNAEHHSHQQHLTEVESATNTESATHPQAPTLHFPVSSEGLRQRKRDSVIPPIKVVENDRGPYPMKVSQVYSDQKKIKKIYHTITGPGVDEGRIGLFTMDRDTGNLYLTQSLDREEQDKYTFQAHATYQDSSEIAEEPMDIVVIVVDQNDNKPAFTQDTFQGEVAEASPIGFEVIQVVATDLDQPDTDNSDIRYSIRSQEPTLPSDSLFVINPVTGVIRVNAGGLDREKYPNYTLVVQAADMMGEGWIGETKVILTVTDRNDNAPAFTQHSSATHPQAPTLHFPVSSEGLRQRKRNWVIPPIKVVENDRGPYPMKVSQIYSDQKKIKKIYLTITGPGVDEGRIGLFTMDRDTGNLYLTQSLDREEQDKYTFQAHATYQDSSEIAEEPMDIVVIVVDQNDNKPVFTQDTFQGEVAEASPIGFEVIQVVATDLDQPDTDNSDIRYSIRSQEPTLPSDSLFVINPVTGVIRVNAGGLDREKYPNYTLVVQAADMMGEGWIGEAKVILTVTDRNDNAPAFTQHSSATHPQAPTLHFPVSSAGLRQRKRNWVIPPIKVVENDRGPYPMKVSQIYSDQKKIKKIYHTITGPGVDEGRIGLFTMDRDTGNLYLTQSLDREEQDKYTFQAHATYQDSSEIAEEPVDIVVIVVDQNDNKPAFTQDTFQGEVAEASPIGFEVIQVVATDLDQPYTENSDIRYSIRSQEPTLPSDSLFVINPVTGVIRVNAGGLDREKYPNYTLVVQAADMMGEGWIGEAKVILTVTDRNDNASAFTQHSSATHPQAPTLHFPVSSEGLRQRKRNWVIPPINVVENDRGPYPMKVSQIYSDQKKIKKIYLTITGPGVDEGRIGLFTMDRDTGNLYLTQSLDREEQDKYTFQAHATYQDSSEIVGEPMDIVVIVVDQNDNKPAFTQDTFQGEVAEASPIGFEVIQVVATDLDQPYTDNSDIRYSIRSQEPTLPSDSLFVINPVTGVIRVNAGGLDREKYPNYTLVVQAADMMGEGWIGEAKVILTVTDRNDNAPAFTQHSSATHPQAPTLHFPVSSEGLRQRKRNWVIPPINVVENDRGPYPMKVSQIYSDQKKIKKIYLTITGPGVDEGRIGLFTMDRDTGNLYLTQSLDREEQDKYTFQAHATYQDSSEIVGEPMDIVVIVVDQNDNKPAFTQDTFQGEVAEASPIGFEVIQVVATDLDQPYTDNSDIRYSIRSQEPTLPSDSLFVINPVTGVIRVNAGGLDREKYPNYTLVVQAADMMGEGWIGEAKVILTVTDRNDNAPAFTQHSSATHPQAPTLHFPVSSEGLRQRKRNWVIPPINVVENDRGPYPMKVSQIYSDQKKIKKIYLTITGPGVDEGRIGLFTMDRDTGNLYLTQSLDREEQDKYTFQAHATYQDSSEIVGEPMDIVVIVVDQNDNKPAFTQDTFQGEVAEASPIGFEVIQVVATDLDQPYTENSDIRYSIRSQEPTLPSDSLFVINPVTGVIRVNAGGLDREKYPNYTLVVQAADMMGEGWIGEAKVILTVTDRNDNAPAFTQHSSATHPQAPTLHFPVSSEGLRRRKRNWVIPPINVVENDRGPYPMKVSQIYSDQKKIKKIYLTITGPGVDEGRIGLFTMDRDTGNLYLTQSLDREEQDKYTFQAHAAYQDSSEIVGEPMDIVVIVVDQNDNKPAFTQDTFQGEVAEASPIGFEVIQVVATDLDQPYTENSDIRYSIRSQEPTLPSDSLFVINPVTGVIRVNAGGLDREKYPNYTLVVQAADMMGEGWIGEAKVILTVTDRNDNASAFTQHSSATHPQAPTLHFPVSSEGLRQRKRNWVIPPIKVVENDRGPYPMKVSQIYSDQKKIKKIYLTITGPGVDEGRIGLFTMDRDTGNLYLTQSLDREEQDKYTFQAHAAYQDSSEIVGEPMDIVVIVVDQNDNKPVFTQDTFQGEVAEASPIGFEVIQVVATDLDQPDTDNSDIRYSIRSQEPTLPSDSLFVINPVTGVIRVNAGGLDREKYPNYTLVVQAADMMGEGWIGEAKVILTVTDRNDNAPAFTQHSSATHPQAPTLHFPVSSEGLRRRKRNWVIPPIHVFENDRGPYPMKVSQIYSDQKKIKKIYLTITGPGVDEGRIGLFTMDRDTGNLYLTQSLDREEQDKYTFQAHAAYQDSSEIVGEPMDIVVIVVDQNDNKPVFTQDTFQGEVAEASPIGFEVIQVVATDLDQPYTDNSDIRYSIRSQEPTLPSDSLFVINPVTGVIRVNAGGLDREKYPNYTLVVQAADMMGEGWIGEAKVILTVTDRNDNASAFTQHSSATHPQAPTLHFPVSSEGLRQRKRNWVIPPINVVENDRGPYPMKVSQIYSDQKKIKKIYLTITGPGVDEGRIGLFTMDRDTGNLYLTQSLDREEQDKYTFQAHAAYQDSSEIVGEPMDIVVIVVDQNDNKPAFTQDTFQGEVAEASPIGFEVIQVVATDLDQPDTDNSDIRYSIRSQEPTLPSDSLFVINPVTGVIRVNAGGLDREKYPNYTLVVQAADMMGEGWIGEAKVILTVTDRNDNAPAFTQHSSATHPQAPTLHFPVSSEGLRRRKRNWVIPPIHVFENDRGPYPMKVSQIYSDQKKIKKIYLTITGPGVDEGRIGLFTMDRDTGNLYLTQSLDREEQDKYTFQAHAAYQDSSEIVGEPMDIVVIVVDQNDNKPVFTQDTFQGEVAEASPIGFEVIQVVATDLDQPYTDNSDIRYSIRSQEPTLPSDSLFVINPVTGVIRVNAGGLDREKYPNYTLVVQAADMMGEGWIGEAKVILTVTDRNDNAPAFTQHSSATHPQAPTLHFPVSSEGLRQRKRNWVIPPINVVENDRGPYPMKVSQIYSDQKKIKKIYLTITGPGVDEGRIGLFTMDRDTGNLYLTQSLDREEQDKYTFQAHATYQDSSEIAEEPMDIVVIVVDQNDNKPVFTQDTFQGEVAEASPIGFEVIQVVATDLDQPDTDNSDIRYSIRSQEPTLPSDSLFVINPVTGVIRVNAGGLDREKYPNYTLVVQAADMMGEGWIGEAKVILTVTDRNDNAPAFTQHSYEATVAENEVDAQVITMSVTDGDEPHSLAWNAKFTIVDGDPGGLFNVTTGSNKHEGIIATAKGLDFERSSKHILLIAVENEVPFATPLPTATATVVVNVQDVSEVPDPIQKQMSKREDHAVDSDVRT